MLQAHMFESLKKYSSIAWDFDGVLDGDTLSGEFQEFIKTNPYGQTHHIVTFRSHGMQFQIPHILSRYPAQLSIDSFGRVLNMPDKLFEISRMFVIFEEYDDPEFLPHLEWKGDRCAEIGAQVLIDDMRNFVLPGCIKNGIDYLHPRDL